MAFGNITAANSTAILVVDTLYPAGVVIEGYSTDSAWTMDSDTIAETRMGIDGRMSAGVVPSIKVVTLTLEANSPSIEPLTRIYQSVQNNYDAYNCKLVISLPALSARYILSDGVMQQAQPMPNINQVLDPVAFVFHFGRLSREDA